ncbi:hypothetical protein SeLEV6574_g03952 [Synchytrium endobioticum]|uniref:Uncharacterized protein n=1 Tax=Synchytrium endobioticum TaxID=286115 RepID=A0A507D1E5_9FUNG|nr:hypothetical protein SeLEV6574_g03952 [Synchytrium endobioticum]
MDVRVAQVGQPFGRMLDRWDSGIKKVGSDNRQKSRIGMADEYERKLLEANNNQYFRTEVYTSTSFLQLHLSVGMEQFTVTYRGYPSEPRNTTVDHSGTTYPITFLPNQARIQHAGQMW